MALIIANARPGTGRVGVALPPIPASREGVALQSPPTPPGQPDEVLRTIEVFGEVVYYDRRRTRAGADRFRRRTGRVPVPRRSGRW
jgi:hypothetical protein